MKPLMTYYSQAVKNWLHSHPGRVVTTFHIAELFRDAYMKAVTVGNAVSGFQATGIWPMKRVFEASDFAGSAPTERDLHVLPVNNFSNEMDVNSTVTLEQPATETITEEQQLKYCICSRST